MLQQDPADKAAALGLTPVSHETIERLDRFVAHLLAVQSHTNLIAPSTIPNLWTRHVADSLQLLDLAPGPCTWIDLGSGGGFPGLVIAAALADQPGFKAHLVESSTKKAAFLAEAARLANIPAEVHPVRIEDFVKNYRGPANVITARALAPLDKLLPLIAPLMIGTNVALLMKGQDVGAELTQASKYWNIDAELVPSRTHPASRIVVLRNLHRKAGKA